MWCGEVPAALGKDGGRVTLCGVLKEGHRVGLDEGDAVPDGRRLEVGLSLPEGVR